MPRLGFLGRVRSIWRRFRKLPPNVVELTGGARFNQLGERSPRKYTFSSIRHLEKGGEGDVALVDLHIRGRWIKLARKTFHHEQEPLQSTGFGVPEHHFNLLTNLKELNRKENLGLHLPNTIRIQGRGKDAVIWTTPIAELKKFKKGDFEQYDHDCERQINILESRGYAVEDFVDNLFIPTRTKEGNVIGVLIDVGHVHRSKNPKEDRFPGRYGRSFS